MKTHEHMKTKAVPDRYLDDEFFTEGELSVRLKISKSKLQKDRVRGEGIPYVMLGSSVRYSARAVAEYLAKNTHQSTSAATAGE